MDAIRILDDALEAEGEDIKLRRVVGTVNQQNVDCDVRAGVRSPRADELVGAITQDDLFCILSPTQINRAQWPGGQPVTLTEDPRIPSKNRGDRAYVRGKWRTVQWGQGFYPQGQLVRIEMRVLG
jgi:hypothetical protein